VAETAPALLVRPAAAAGGAYRAGEVVPPGESEEMMRSMRRELATAGVLAVLALAGCGSGGVGATPVTATGSLEQLASRTGCAPDLQTDAEQIRQALCRTAGGRFVLATFTTDEDQRTWLDEAEAYGGHYLVGAGWVAVGEEDVLTAVRGQLGGTPEEGVAHHGGGGGEQMQHDHQGG
jgi:hypothetical protein